MKRFQTSFVVLTFALAACGSPAQSHGGPVRDHVSFVDALRASGLTVQVVSSASQPFLHPQTGTLLRVTGGKVAQAADVQSFEYASTAAARQDASTIQPDGNPRNAMVNWVGSPHFFLRERILVLYVGGDPEVLKVLGNTVGGPFAGK